MHGVWWQSRCLEAGFARHDGAGGSVRRVTSPSLARRLGLGDAVFIGLGSMIGAGVFAAFAPAAAAAGSGLLIGLGIAAVVAFGNATSSAQLAAAHPTSGGTYAYGRAELGEWWGFIAGWSFVVGKIASCAAMALTFAAYAAPPGWERPVAILAVAALATVNWFGVTRTAQLTRIIVVVVLLSLAVAVAAGATAPDAPGWLDADALWSGGWYGILQAGGLLFFAFAGYARIATMGEEVRDPARTIPRAIVFALAGAVVVYAAVGIARAVHTRTGGDGAVDASRSWTLSSPRDGTGRSPSSASARPRHRSARSSPSSPGSAAPRSRWRASRISRGSSRRSTRAGRCRIAPKSPSR